MNEFGEHDYCVILWFTLLFLIHAISTINLLYFNRRVLVVSVFYFLKFVVSPYRVSPYLCMCLCNLACHDYRAVETTFGWKIRKKRKTSGFMKINSSVGRHQEASVLLKQDDTKLHQEQAYRIEGRHLRNQCIVEKRSVRCNHPLRPSTSTSPMTSGLDSYHERPVGGSFSLCDWRIFWWWREHTPQLGKWCF